MITWYQTPNFYIHHALSQVYMYIGLYMYATASKIKVTLVMNSWDYLVVSSVNLLNYIAGFKFN